jgi:hypothetical protein
MIVKEHAFVADTAVVRPCGLDLNTFFALFVAEQIQIKHGLMSVPEKPLHIRGQTVEPITLLQSVHNRFAVRASFVLAPHYFNLA